MLYANSVALQANTVVSYLEPDARGELSFVCTSTQPPTHASYCHVVPLSNRQSCPLMFSLTTEGPFKLVSSVPSAPQVSRRGQKVLGPYFAAES